MDPSCADAMGVFVASDEHTFHRASASASASVWTDAVRVKAALNAKLAKRNRDTNTGFLRYVSDVRAYFEKKVGKKRGVSFEVTNVGVVDGGEEGRWRMSRMMFTQSASVTGAAVQFSVSSVKGGALCVCATWQEALVERTFVEGVLRGYEQLVEDITKEG
ncbi:hypothetical protein OF83DRAFT_1170424 [Amylostereum chailletii]|nr:hypothetical protein OF83DRAFT_1170424 [Amylostereum chailletii]